MTRISSKADFLAGRISCGNCNGLLLPDATICRFCGESTGVSLTRPAATRTPTPAPVPAPAMGPAEPSPGAPTEPAAKKAKASTPAQRHKKLVALWADPTCRKSWEAVALGNPITKGSGNAIAAGVYAHQHGDSLRRWEQAIEDAFAALYRHPDWEPLDVPLVLDAVFTLPRPKGLSKNQLFYPDARPDLDKLLRAAGDGISQTRTDRIKHGPNAYKEHFNLVREDGRIIEEHIYKTYPRPYHTHPAALDEPGVQLRVRVAPDPNTKWPDNY